MRLARGETTQGADGRALLNELVRLRPFGEAYVMKNFGERLSHADAEDAVSDVTLRLHRQIAAGNLPDNLQAAFLTGARNAAIDRLRRRTRKPTVEIEAAADAAAELPPPEDLAERRETAARIREVLLRVNPRQRRVLHLRFGKGETVPEIAAEMGISLPAAKNLLARGVSQARMQLEAIDGREVCGAMQGELREALDRELTGTDSDRILKAHLEHCGTCKSFMHSMRRDLHGIGAPAALGAVGLHFEPLHHLGRAVGQATDLTHAALGKAKLAAFRVVGFGGDATGGAGALAGTGQKVAALCGAAATTTCLATGLVGPGAGILAHHHSGDPVAHRSAAKVRPLSEWPNDEPEVPPTSEPATSEPQPEPAESASGGNDAQPVPEGAPEPTPAEQGEEEFGLEGTAPPPEPAPTPEASPAATSTAASSAGTGGGSGGAEKFGFGG